MALLMEPVAQVILAGYDAGQTPDERDLGRLTAIAAARGITASAQDIARHLEIANADVVDVDDHVVRAQELAALLDPTDNSSSSVGLPPLIEPRPLTDYHGPLFAGDTRRFAAVSAVPRLAETRALVGFTRVDPGRPSPQEGFAQQWGAPLDATRERDWLLAHRVYGEGILLVLDPDAVRRWAGGEGDVFVCVVGEEADHWGEGPSAVVARSVEFEHPAHDVAHGVAFGVCCCPEHGGEDLVGLAPPEPVMRSVVAACPGEHLGGSERACQSFGGRRAGSRWRCRRR